MNRGRIWAIARWEYLQKVRSKGFIISLILTPVLITAFSVIPTLLADQGPGETQIVGVVDKTGRFLRPLKEQMESRKLPGGQPVYLLVDYMMGGRSPDSALAEADRAALGENIEGTLVIQASDSLGTPQVIYRSPNPSNFRLISTFESAIGRLNTELRLREMGVDTAAFARITEDVELTTVKVSKQGEEESGGFLATFFAGYAGSFLLMFLILTTGQSLVRSLVEEKSNRIMELLVGASTPQELMWGKLMGLSGLGLTQLFVWGVLGLGAITNFSASEGVNAWLQSLYAVLPYILVYMALGYVFYAALFIGVGSLVTTEQEAQVATSYLVMLLVIPVAFAIVVVQNPDVGYIRVLSYVPLFTPSLMMIRVVTKMPPLWEVMATIGMLLVSTVFVVWAAGRIFRTAILMYGKRPSFGEIMRWMKAG